MGSEDVQTTTLPDGRRLAYQGFGDPEGRPVFYFHGWPSSRLDASLFGDLAASAGLRMIGVDRPGIGRSDFQPGRTLLHWPKDVDALADALGLERFAVFGVSGGGPYVAACAYAIAERLTSATIVAGLAPMTRSETLRGMPLANRFMLQVGRPLPWLLRGMLSMMHRQISRPGTIERMFATLPPVDRAAIEHLGTKRFAAVLEESYRQGTAGPTHEGRIYASPWGFELEHIPMPVTIWQGELDQNVPPSSGRIFAREIPNAKAHFVPGEGHVSLLVNHGEAILASIT
ncbi:MAG: alpha/beta hydrolase [Myxococcota bacterium]